MYKHVHVHARASNIGDKTSQRDILTVLLFSCTVKQFTIVMCYMKHSLAYVTIIFHDMTICNLYSIHMYFEHKTPFHTITFFFHY